MRILVVNAGSSSLKVDLLDGGRHIGAFDHLPDPPPTVDAVGHRIVHGGERFVAPTIVDDTVERQLRALTELAPLHQPLSLRALAAAREALPGVPHVACFDTAFHANLPVAAATFALPADWRERYRLRRFGFHGLSHSWAYQRAISLASPAGRLVSCHLGAGASVTAIRDGRSVDTTMGFTPLDGIVMATRSGSIDPGLVTWLQEHHGISAHEVADALENRSGLLGLAGTADMRDVLARDDAEARLAFDVYVLRLAAAVAAMTVSLDGLDVLVFTGGVGENAAEVRSATSRRLRHLGVAVEEDRNRAVTPDDSISPSSAEVTVLVIRSREDLAIAAGVRQALSVGA